MDPRDLETYLRAHIPLSDAMDVHVQDATPDTVILSAPLEPNLNHRETVFGGSASTLAILAAWTLVYVRLRAEGMQGRIVIQRNSVEYQRPILGDFQASSRLHDPADWTRFMLLLRRKGKSRIKVAVSLTCQKECVGSFEGDFVAFAPE